MPMERRPFGRDWGLSLRMTLCLVLLAGLYLPFLLWFLGFVYFFGGTAGVVVGALAALGLLALAPYLSELLALNTARVQWDHEAIDARLRPMAERLCALADLPVPRLAVMPTDIPNAFSAGRSPNRGVVVVTEGLLGDLDDAELEAVVAHELAHIANRDAFVMTIAAAPSMVGRKLLWGFALLPFTAEGPKKIFAAIAVLYLLPLLFLGWVVYAFAALLVMSITRYREFVADRGSAILTGAPEQLSSALQKIAGAMPLIPQRDLREVTGMNSLFVLPARAEGDSFEVDPLRIFPTHPPLDRRLERLAAFARDLGRSRGVEPAGAPVEVDLPARPRRENPQALAAFFLAVAVWGATAALLVAGSEAAMEGMVWVSVFCVLALAAGVFFGFQGVGRASAGADGMGYAVAGLALLLGPWVLALFAMIVFMMLAVFGAGPVG
jgi:heat shock protein HtpX